MTPLATDDPSDPHATTPDADAPDGIDPERLALVVETIAMAERLPVGHPDAIALQRATSRLYKRVKRQRRSDKRRQVVEHDEAITALTATGAPGRIDDETQGLPLVSSARGALAGTLIDARACYVCKDRYREVDAFYHQLCPTCAAKNHAKRDARTDLTGRRALLTGGRAKIGMYIALRLLRDGAHTTITTRFPRDAARRFAAMPDSGDWLHRLRIIGTDLRDPAQVIALADAVAARGPLDILINNAAQTVRRSAASYAPLVEAERAELPVGWREAGLEIETLGRGGAGSAGGPMATSIADGPAVGGALGAVADGDGAAGAARGGASGDGATGDVPGGGGADADADAEGAEAGGRGVDAEGGAPAAVTGLDGSSGGPAAGTAYWSPTPEVLAGMALEARSATFDKVAMGRAIDAGGLVPDLHHTNSWVQTVEEVDPLEMLEVQLCNMTAPFILVSRLRASLASSPARRTYVVNVSAMEGQFGRYYKGAGHPHTNMAKAALNMLTKTSAKEMLESDGILMTAVDTGWITDERPHPQKMRLADSGFHAPLDLVDGAARVYDPIVRGEAGEDVHGCFLKDYEKSPW
ncbi:MAG: SDR family NAD(P)-dependent oxidoreductase [Solirubrobacteraceae bacterium]|nr:SDR family NAD(P)-dependent oxidoreductase [Solirubrobacteraceae bacterium]